MKVVITIHVHNVIKTLLSDTTYFNISEKFMIKMTHLYVLIAISHLNRKEAEIDTTGPAKKKLKIK